MLQQLHIDPRITWLFIFAFIAIGIFFLYRSVQRIQQQRSKGVKIRWFTDIKVLTACEYILLGLVLMVNQLITIGLFSTSVSYLIVPVYYFIILLTAFVMVLIIYQSTIVTGRQRRAAAAQMRQREERAEQQINQGKSLTDEQQAHRRDHRKKAAAARRRQAGKA